MKKVSAVAISRRVRAWRDCILLDFGYNGDIDIRIAYKQSAFKHGVTKNDIRWVF